MKNNTDQFLLSLLDMDTSETHQFVDDMGNRYGEIKSPHVRISISPSLKPEIVHFLLEVKAQNVAWKQYKNFYCHYGDVPQFMAYLNEKRNERDCRGSTLSEKYSADVVHDIKTDGLKALSEIMSEEELKRGVKLSFPSLKGASQFKTLYSKPYRDTGKTLSLVIDDWDLASHTFLCPAPIFIELANPKLTYDKAGMKVSIPIEDWHHYPVLMAHHDIYQAFEAQAKPKALNLQAILCSIKDIIKNPEHPHEVRKDLKQMVVEVKNTRECDDIKVRHI